MKFKKKGEYEEMKNEDRVDINDNDNIYKNSINESDLMALINQYVTDLKFGEKKLTEKIEFLLSLKVENELLVHVLLRMGVEKNLISVESAAAIANRSKDSISELVKISQLLGGKPTGIQQYLVEKVDLEERANQLLQSRLRDGVQN